MLFLIISILKTNKMLTLNHNKIDHKTHLISGANSDMFWYQDAIIRLTYEHLFLAMVMAYWCWIM